MQFSDHADCDGALFFKHAAELGLEGIVSKRARSLYRGGPSKNWLKTKNMVEGEFILLGTEVDDSGIPWGNRLKAPWSRKAATSHYNAPALSRRCHQICGRWSIMDQAISASRDA